MLAETEKLVDCERRLYESEQQLSAVRAQNVRLQLRVDEMRIKLEPGEQLLYRVFLVVVYSCMLSVSQRRSMEFGVNVARL